VGEHGSNPHDHSQSQPFRGTQQQTSSGSTQWDRRSSNPERSFGAPNAREHGFSYEGLAYDERGNTSRLNSNNVLRGDSARPATHTPVYTGPRESLPTSQDNPPLAPKTSKSRLSSSAPPFEPASMYLATGDAASTAGDKYVGDVFYSAEASTTTAKNASSNGEKEDAKKEDAIKRLNNLEKKIPTESQLSLTTLPELGHDTKETSSSPDEVKDATFQENVSAAKGIKESLHADTICSLVGTTAKPSSDIPSVESITHLPSQELIGATGVSSQPPLSTVDSVAQSLAGFKFFDEMVDKKCDGDMGLYSCAVKRNTGAERGTGLEKSGSVSSAVTEAFSPGAVVPK